MFSTSLGEGFSHLRGVGSALVEKTCAAPSTPVLLFLSIAFLKVGSPLSGSSDLRSSYGVLGAIPEFPNLSRTIWADVRGDGSGACSNTVLTAPATVKPKLCRDTVKFFKEAKRFAEEAGAIERPFRVACMRVR